MSREEQIDEMAKITIAHCELDNQCGSCHWETCNECLAEALYNAGYCKQEWISVDERLPPKYEKVLVFDGGVIDTTWINSQGVWYDHSMYSVSHWMPLPEAPKMKGGAE